MALRFAVLGASLFLVALGFRSEVAVGSSGQAALIEASELEEDANNDDVFNPMTADAIAVVAADADIAKLPDALLTFTRTPLSDAPLAQDLRDGSALPEEHLKKIASDGSAPPPSPASPVGGRHTARYMAVASRAAPSDDASPSAATGATENTATVSAADGAGASSGELAASSAASGAALGRAAAQATRSESAAPAPKDGDHVGAASQATRSETADPGSRVTPSLLEGRVASWASTAVARVAARSRSVPGGWGKLVVAACLVALMILCASPCAAALCPARGAQNQKSERPRRRPLPKSVMVGKRGLTRQEKLGDILADVASSGSEGEEQADKLSHSLTQDLSAIVASSVGCSSFVKKLSSDDMEKKASEDQERSMRKEVKLVVSDVSRIAKQLQTSALKYPKSGRSGFIFGNSAQKRFLLVLAQPDGESSKKRSDGSSQEPTRELLLWRAGRLAWWETETAFQQKTKPKGSIPLAKIHDVQQGKEPMSVIIDHQDRDSKCTLELVFSSGQASKAWSADFRELLVKLNTEIS